MIIDVVLVVVRIPDIDLRMACVIISDATVHRLLSFQKGVVWDSMSFYQEGRFLAGAWGI